MQEPADSLQINRRDFLKTVGMGVASVVVPSPLYSALAIPRPKTRLGIALVGLGYYSTDLLAPALLETKHCYLAGIVTGTPAKAEEWTKQFNLPSKNVYNYQNFDQVANNSDIDIIYVVLPPSMHAEYTIRAAKAGKHVFCEKPMALSVRECEQMIKACEDNHVSLAIGYRMQHEPNTREVIRLGQRKVFGNVKTIAAGAGYTESRKDHWKLKKAYGGGAMMDMGVYALQAARYVTGEEPVSVSAQHSTTRPELFKEVDETTKVQLQFPSGAMANLETSFGKGLNYLDVKAEKGWFKLEPFQAYSGVHGSSSNGSINLPGGNEQAKQMDDDSLAIMNKTPLIAPGEEGSRDIRVIEAIYQAGRTGKPVKLG